MFGLGILYTSAFAPFGLALLLPLFLLPVLYVCLTVAPRDAGWLAFFFGFGTFLSGTYWIYISVVVFGEAPTWIALVLMLGLVMIMSAYLWLTGWLISRLTHGEPWLLLLVAPAVWVLIEWARGWILSGFPWLAIGYSQVDTPLSGWAPVVGVYGASYMMMLSATALLVAITLAGRQRLAALSVSIAPWILGGILSWVEWTEPVGEPVRTTLLQYGISQDQKWKPESLQPTLAYYRGESARAEDSELVVWPEVAIPSLTDRAEPFIKVLEADAAQRGQSIVFGILERATERGETRIHNSLVLVDGERRQFYRKRHLVPFGEYFPVPAKVREWMRMLSLPHSDLTPGADVQPLLTTANGTPLASAICYEDAYGAEQLYALPEAEILVNVSNDAWFGDSIAPHQHLQIARMRSLEAGRSTVRVANTGISAFIGPDGDVIERGPQFESVEMTMDVERRRGATPYVSLGNYPVLLLCFALAGFCWIRSRASL